MSDNMGKDGYTPSPFADEDDDLKSRAKDFDAIISVYDNDRKKHSFLISELMNWKEWRNWVEFHELLEDKGETLQDFADKAPKLNDLLKSTPTSNELKRRAKKRVNK